MDAKDTNQNGIQVVRDSSSDVAVDSKGIPYGFECVSFSDEGIAEYRNMGDIQGMGYIAPASSATRNNLGSYANAVPSVLKNDDGKVYPVLDKTLAIDASYAGKDSASEVSDDHSKVRIAEITEDGTPGIVVTCLNANSQEQIFFPIAGNTTLYARVRWNFTSEDGDLSEGELLSYDSETDSYSATGVAIWIDTEKSSQCQFHTCGNNTVFTIKLVKKDVERGEVTRDLYYCTQCVKDDGYAITHFEKIAKAGDGYLDVNFLSDEISFPPWELINCKIYTTIISTPSENILIVKVPEDWDAGTSSLANWDYTEISDISKGIFFLAKPIRPRLTDIDTLQWESVEYYDGSTISTYQTKE